MGAKAVTVKIHTVLAVALLGIGMLVLWVWSRMPAPLRAVEAQCVGSWCFVSPDAPTTLIEYEFQEDRGVNERHYYLTSATPTTPRVTFVGQWRIEPDGQMVVEPASGITGAAYNVSGAARGALGDDAHLPRPVLRRFYWIEAATSHGIDVRCSSGEWTMKPFLGAKSISVGSEPPRF